MSINVIPKGAALGAEIRGLDVSHELAPSETAAIQSAWRDYLVIFFRDQQLTDEQLLHFSRVFGDLDASPASELLDRGGSSSRSSPDVWIISNVIKDGQPIGSLGAGEAEWHTDMSYVETPPKASVLYALEIPPSGGDTYFANMYRAIEELPSDLRREIEGRRAIHSSTHTSAGELRVGQQAVLEDGRIPGAHHPIVRIHEETGREALYLGRRTNGYVDELSIEESDALLDRLWADCTRLELIYRHKWRVGDLLMWDNRCVIHRRDAFDPASRRIMHRTQIRQSAA